MCIGTWYLACMCEDLLELELQTVVWAFMWELGIEPGRAASALNQWTISPTSSSYYLLIDFFGLITYFILFIIYIFETGFLCVALAVMELAL